MGLERLKLAAVVPVLALAVGATAALGAERFRDPVGDVEGGPGPDVTSISVSHTATTVTFRVGFAKAPPLGANLRERWVDMLIVALDVPPRGLRRVPGGWTGADYYAGLHGADAAATVVKQARPSAWPGVVVARPRVGRSGRTLSFTVRRATLGDPAWIDFTVAAGRELTDRATGGGADYAPARGTFHYRLR